MGKGEAVDCRRQESESALTTKTITAAANERKKRAECLVNKYYKISNSTTSLLLFPEFPTARWSEKKMHFISHTVAHQRAKRFCMFRQPVNKRNAEEFNDL